VGAAQVLLGLTAGAGQAAVGVAAAFFKCVFGVRNPLARTVLHVGEEGIAFLGRRLLGAHQRLTGVLAGGVHTVTGFVEQILGAVLQPREQGIAALAGRLGSLFDGLTAVVHFVAQVFCALLEAAHQSVAFLTRLLGHVLGGAAAFVGSVAQVTDKATNLGRVLLVVFLLQVFLELLGGVTSVFTQLRGAGGGHLRQRAGAVLRLLEPVRAFLAQGVEGLPDGGAHGLLVGVLGAAGRVAGAHDETPAQITVEGEGGERPQENQAAGAHATGVLVAHVVLLSVQPGGCLAGQYCYCAPHPPGRVWGECNAEFIFGNTSGPGTAWRTAPLPETAPHS